MTSVGDQFKLVHYNISERDILVAIESPDLSGGEGDKVVVVKMFQDKFSGFPLKVVYEKK